MDQNDKNKSNKNNDRRKGVLSLLIWALVLTIGFNYLLSAMDTRKLAESTCEIRYDEFLDLVRDGKVKEVEIADRTLNITPVDGFTYTDADGKTYSGDFQLFTTQINDPELRSFLDENGVEFGKPYKAETSYLEIIMLNYVLPTALMVGAFILMMRFISKKTGGGGFGGLGSVGKSNAKVYMEKSTGVTFADVAGQDEAKESLVEIIDFLHNPQKYTDIGAKLPRGALLVGPGTLLAGAAPALLCAAGPVLVQGALSVWFLHSMQRLNDAIPSDRRATLISVDSMAYSLLMIPASPLVGLVGDLTGQAGAGLCVLCALVVVSGLAAAGKTRYNGRGS